MSRRVLPDHALRQARRNLFALGVHRDGQAELCGFAHSLVERQIVGAGKLFQSGVTEKRLEARRRARPAEFGELAPIALERCCPARYRPTVRSP